MGGFLILLTVGTIVFLIGATIHSFVELGIPPFTAVWRAWYRQSRAINKRTAQLINEGWSLRTARGKAEQEILKNQPNRY